MPQYLKKNLPLFFSARDEAAFGNELKTGVPDICFIDGSVWETTKPPTRTSLADCKSSVVYLWSPQTCPALPFQALAEGRARGPTSGVVIQFMRSRLKDGILTSGDLGIGYDKADLAMGQFVKTVWHVAKIMNGGLLQSFHRSTGETLEEHISIYLIGQGAMDLARSGTTLKHCAADVYYRCQSAED